MPLADSSSFSRPHGSPLQSVPTMRMLSQSKEFAWRAAESATASFCLPPSVLADDVADLVRSGSIENLIASRQFVASPNRFNPDRCVRAFQNDPEFSRLMEIASGGAIIEVDPFRPHIRAGGFSSSPSSNPAHFHVARSPVVVQRSGDYDSNVNRSRFKSSF
jgi:hypothetical protein